MLTLRRGIARVGWVLLLVWTASIVALMISVSGDPNVNPLLQVTVLTGVPLAIFLFWRLLLWIGQGFWQNAAAPQDVAPNAFRLPAGFWTIRTMALLGAVLFAAYHMFELRSEWTLGGDYASRAVGGFVAYAAIGAIFGAVIARFLPKP